MLRKLSSYRRQNGLALALRELGRLERSLHMLDWIEDIEYRRRALVGLNKGESEHALARALFFGRSSEVRERTRAGQLRRASGLTLVLAAIVLWNTVYIDKAVSYLRDKGQGPSDEHLAHLSPLGWQHINFIGDYFWQPQQGLSKQNLRPLNEPVATGLNGP